MTVDLDTIAALGGLLVLLGAGIFLATRNARTLRADSYFWDDVFAVRGGPGSAKAHEPDDEPWRGPRAWYEVLGVPPGASRRDIKAAYRRKIVQFHPDRTAGLTGAARIYADAEARAVNEAYRQGLKGRGR